jgi:hypothetical protein
MNARFSDHQPLRSRLYTAENEEGELSRLTHSLQGSISALLMCEHMMAKELTPTEELASNPTLATSLTLLKETVDQIRDCGEELMRLSQR